MRVINYITNHFQYVSNTTDNKDLYVIDYCTFGSLMPGRQYSSGTGYRFGFNGKEMDNEVKGVGNSVDFGARIYDSRLGKWLSPDAFEKKYPYLTPYNFCANVPILYVDPDGNIITISSTQYKEHEPIVTVVVFKDGKLFNKDGTDYVGNDEYILKVQNTLNNLKAIDVRVNQVITDLENDDQTNIIANSDYNMGDREDRVGRVDGSYNRGVKNEDGVRTLTKFLPDRDRLKETGKDFTNEEILGHELKHGWNKLKKYNDVNQRTQIKSQNGKTNCEEVDAVNFQNIISWKQKGCIRTEYGKGNELGGGDIESPDKYKLE